MNDFRLSKDVRPSHYEVRFDLDLDTWTSKGTGKITLRAGDATRELVVHCVELEITSARIAGGPSMSGVSYDEESQTATLAFDGEIKAGEHTLEIGWTGGIRDSLRGLYRSTRGEERYATTQFEAADARRAMPCFDEPEFKATWTIELVHATALATISNNPIEKQEQLAEGRTLTRFVRMPKISSYLVAFCVGPFQSTPVAKTKRGVEVRVWAPPGLAERGIYARDSHVRALEYLEGYTGMAYPYIKVDAIGLPDFEAGAMENPGAITYRTTYLSVDERTASSAAFKGCFSVAAHELTHMWWGDLVTMAWWTDLWLNESFASFVGEKATDALNPQWGYRRDVVGQNTSAFNLDALLSTHPISVEAKNADEASERFDSVTYLKGQGVLRMIESYVTADAFRAGVRIYLDRHKEANATASDFWRALDEASGKDISKIANAWITEPGHPLVGCSVEQEPDGLKVTMRQSRFFADPALKDTGQRWPVPVVIRYGTQGGTAEQRVLIDGDSARAHLPGATWYYPNAGGTGFYRTALDERSSALLASNVRSLSPEERLALVDNQWALARAQKISVQQVLELVAGLRGEDDRYVLAQLAGITDWLATHAVTDATSAALRRTVDALFRPQLERLGWNVRQDDTADERETRAIVIGALGSTAAAQDVRAEARRRVDAHLDGQDLLHPDIARAVAAVAAAEGDLALWQRYVQRMRTAAQSDAQEELRFRAALVEFEDPAVVDRTADEIFTDLIRDQDRSLLYVRLLGTRHGRQIGWRALKDHWDSHVLNMDPAGKQRCVDAASQISPKELSEDVARFLTAKQTPDVKETVAQATERVRLLAATAERMSRELGAALERIAQPA